MWSFVLSGANVFMLCYVAYLCIKRHIDTAIVYYCIISLFFVNIPLFYDSIMALFHGIGHWDYILRSVNRYWSSGSLSIIDRVSFDSLIFNIAFLLSYYVVCRKKILSHKFCYRSLSKHTLASLSWPMCFFFAILGLVTFMVYNNISSFRMMEVSEWYENQSHNRVLGLLASLFVPLMSVGVLRMLYTKDFLKGGILLMPVIAIGFFTGARSQIISVIFYFLFYFLWKNREFRVWRILPLTVFAFVVVYLMTSFREEITGIYPIYKDWAYVDLFYVYKMGNSLDTHGMNTLTMILRDFMPEHVEDITYVVAESKFGAGWGTLHPSLLGWAYVDLKSLFWLLAVYLGAFVALFDRLRHRMPSLIYFLFLSYEFSFLAIAIRGSLKFAYSELLYPTLILILFVILDKLNVVKIYYNENRSNK